MEDDELDSIQHPLTARCFGQAEEQDYTARALNTHYPVTFAMVSK